MKFIKWWFWSLKPDNENWAQTLVRVFGNLIRCSITLLFLGTLIFLGVLYIQEQNRISKLPPKDYQTVVGIENNSKITLNFVHRDNSENGVCSEFAPLGVWIKNNTDQALIGVDVRISGRVVGTTRLDVDRVRSYERIIPPGKSDGACFNLGNKPNSGDLRYKVTIVQARYRPLEDWMLEDWKILHPETDDKK